MITIKDIAQEAQVSEGTVDRVIHNRGGVSKKTEAKIRLILKKHDYKVNPVARALALKKHHSIAALIPLSDKINEFWKFPLTGIQKASDEVINFGVQVNVYYFDQFDPASYLTSFESLIRTGPSAVILVPSFVRETKNIVARLEERRIPYLFLNIDLEGFQNIAFIGQHSYDSGKVAGKLTQLALGHGTTEIAIIETRSNLSNYRGISNRIKGFKDHFNRNSIPIEHLNLVFDNETDTKNISFRLNNFLRARVRIKAVFVPSSRISIIANLIEPELLKKLILIGFDNTPQNIRSLEQGKVLILVSQKPFFQGYDSVNVMTDYLLKNKVPSKKIYSSIDIVIKENLKYNGRMGDTLLDKQVHRAESPS